MLVLIVLWSIMGQLYVLIPLVHDVMPLLKIAMTDQKKKAPLKTRSISEMLIPMTNFSKLLNSWDN